MAAAMRSESESDSLIAFPSSCIKSFSFSSTACPLPDSEPVRPQYGTALRIPYFLDVPKSSLVSSLLLTEQRPSSSYLTYLSDELIHHNSVRYTSIQAL